MNKLKEFRLSLGLSQQKFCDKIAMKRSTYDAYETMRRKPKEYFLNKLIEFAKQHNFLLTEKDFKG